MKKYLLLLFLALPLLSFNSLHKFYLSVTDINYNPETKSLEIIARVFTDDMENVLRLRHGDSFFLTRKQEHDSADLYIADYLNDRLEISVDGIQKKLTYLGKEYDKDQLVLYIEVENTDPFKNITIRNDILTGLFPDQKNVVHVELDEVTKSLLLTRGEGTGVLNFNK